MPALRGFTVRSQAGAETRLAIDVPIQTWPTAGTSAHRASTFVVEFKVGIR
jgi:hypothetical protein